MKVGGDKLEVECTTTCCVCLEEVQQTCKKCDTCVEHTCTNCILKMCSIHVKPKSVTVIGRGSVLFCRKIVDTNTLTYMMYSCPICRSLNNFDMMDYKKDLKLFLKEQKDQQFSFHAPETYLSLKVELVGDDTLIFSVGL